MILSPGIDRLRAVKTYGGYLLRKPERHLEIIVPREYAEPRPLKCNSPGCLQTFRVSEASLWQRHCVECGVRHLDEIRAIAPSVRDKGTIWDENQWDPEIAAHMRRVGERMLKDGDFEVHKHEQAGHS